VWPGYGGAKITDGSEKTLNEEESEKVTRGRFGASWRNKRVKKQRGNNNDNQDETKREIKKQYRKMESVTGDRTLEKRK